MTARGTQEVDTGVPASEVAGTPLPLGGDGTAEALETMELAAVLELVGAHAAGPLGAARVRARRPTDDVAWIRQELARVGEVAGLFRRGDALAAEPVPDVGLALARLRVEGSVLDGRELLDIGRALAAAGLVHADLSRVAESAPRAAALLRPIPDGAVVRRLELSLDADGTLLDTASPRLAAARREVQAARERLVRRLEAILRGLDAGAGSHDAAVTVRNGRYVIPVRRDSRARPGGIVHDESGSAGTLFVEPAETIELGNALREATVAEEREELRVLRDLTGLLRPIRLLIRDAYEMCIAVDDLVARARWAVAAAGEVPEVAAAPAPLAIRNGRHPLLFAGTEPVVPFDLELNAEERTLLVSGPNTGGKTVLLKAVALACVLAQSGILPPVGAESALPVFGRFYADIGDRQSIAASLSTFSAHVSLLRRILHEADDATLVLLDEVGSGTDPAEGGALAAATLAALTRRGTLTLATTHLGALKHLATQMPGVVNASLEFDGATLRPTYRLRKGVPGRSYGLAIARRLGIDDEVLADAERRVPAGERALDELLASVEARARTLETAQTELAALRAETESLAAQLAADAEAQTARAVELARRERDTERRAREQARAFLLDARERVEEALGRAREAADDERARAARRLLEERVKAEGEALAALEEGAGPAASDPAGAVARVEVGGQVRVGAGPVGEVVEIRADGRLVVLAGAMRMVVEPQHVVPLRGREDRRAAEAVARDAARATGGRGDEVVEAALEIDLRGMTGDEAVAATVAAIDAAVLAANPFLRIIHGMGTGVLRERVHGAVRGDRRVANFALAPRNQGGAGVTIVEFTA
ncbi:MAG TPA: Smr/MutS family protein [Gemmatimonadales bacterium]|nr:Smr/MutS family protein [Gemmatimonadales bacterium]